MRPSFAEQLRVAFEASGLTVEQLIDKAKLDLERTSLGKKLHGKQRLMTDEAEAIADVLGVDLVWAARRRKRRGPTSSAEAA